MFFNPSHHVREMKLLVLLCCKAVAAVQKIKVFASTLMKQSFAWHGVPNMLPIEAIKPHPKPKNNIGIVLN